MHWDFKNRTWSTVFIAKSTNSISSGFYFTQSFVGNSRNLLIFWNNIILFWRVVHIIDKVLLKILKYLSILLILLKNTFLGKRYRGCPTPSFNDFLGSWESWQVLWNGYHGQQFDQHPCFTTSAATTSSDYHLRRSSMPNHHCKVLVDIYFLFLLTEDRAIILAP